MLLIRKANERGAAKSAWLDSKHSFSFGEYFDPKYMGFHTLRVINEDKIQAGKGFDTHPHKDMEIISYVLQGSLQHKDSMGNTTIIRPNEIQKMSAGTGVLHSEYNHEKDKETHFYQIWILPKRKGLSPSYAQKPVASDLNSLVLVASNTGKEGSIIIDQDLDIYLARLKEGNSLQYECRPGKKIWVQILKGSISINNISAAEGDGIAIEKEMLLKFKALKDSEMLLFDLS